MSVQSVLNKLGVHYRVIDDEAFAPCPFHSPDHHPSWSVNLGNGVHYCFACGARGNLAFLIAKLSDVTYEEAVIQANEAVGFVEMGKWKEKVDNISFSPMSLKITEMDMALFTDPPEEALNSKNITAEAAEYYGIRWNPEHKTWIFPYRDPFSNELWGWQEKNARIFRNYPAGTKKSRTLFGYDKMGKDCTGIIVESPIDCGKVYDIDLGYWGDTVSSFGLPSLYQLSLIQRKCSYLFFCLDNDAAGIKTTRDLIPDAVKMFSHVRVFNYQGSSAKDIGEMDIWDADDGFHESIPALEWLRYNNNV